MKKFFGMLTKQFVEFVVLKLHNTYIIVSKRSLFTSKDKHLLKQSLFISWNFNVK